MKIQSEYQPNAVRIPLIVVSFLFLLLVFALTTPFDFAWPQTVVIMENTFNVNDAISRMQHGNTWRRVGLLMLATFSLVNLAWTKNRYKLNLPVALFMGAYLSLVLLSLTWSIDPFFTLRRIIIVFILWFSATVAAGRYSLRELAWLSVLVTGTTLAMAIFNEIRWQTMNPADEIWRFAGLFHTVTMGWNCGLLILSSLFLLTKENHSVSQILLWIIIATAFVFLVLTKSRMAVIATLAGMGCFWYGRITAMNKILSVLILVMSACVIYLAIGDKLLYYGEEASTLGRGEAAKESVSNLTGRTQLWGECFKWADKRPLQGYGFNTFISPKNINTISRNVGWLPNSTHSGYIDAILGIGYPGAACLILFLFSGLVRAIMMSRLHPEYIFGASILLWLSLNLFLEANLITRPIFMTFFSMTILARLAFLSEEDWGQ